MTGFATSNQIQRRNECLNRQQQIRLRQEVHISKPTDAFLLRLY